MNAQQRLVLVVAILSSGVAFLDSSVVNVALPAIGRELGGGLTIQQWVVDAYLITLGSFILLAGSLSDLFGRRRILAAGLLGFGVSSILCALAPTGGFLIAGRAVQGLAGALLVPSSLALIMVAFTGESQGKAIGTWTAWTGIAMLIGPLLGGYLVDAGSWRWVFGINVPPIFVILWLMRRLKVAGESKSDAHIDILGAMLCILGLGGPVYALIEQPHLGWRSPFVLAPLVIGLLFLACFVWHEAKTKEPMLPLSLFSVRNYSAGNLATLSIYGALSISSFLLIVFEQQVGHYTAFAAGLSLLPVTIIMFLLSPRFGALAGKHGPRVFMTAGPIVAAAGFLLMFRVDRSVAYWTQLFPGIILFGAGLSMTVAPLTSAILAPIDKSHAGVGSAVNNAVARIAGLLAIAAVGVVTGRQLTLAGFQHALILVIALLIVGGLISALGIRNPSRA